MVGLEECRLAESLRKLRFPQTKSDQMAAEPVETPYRSWLFFFNYWACRWWRWNWTSACGCAAGSSPRSTTHPAASGERCSSTGATRWKWPSRTWPRCRPSSARTAATRAAPSWPPSRQCLLFRFVVLRFVSLLMFFILLFILLFTVLFIFHFILLFTVLFTFLFILLFILLGFTCLPIIGTYLPIFLILLTSLNTYLTYLHWPTFRLLDFDWLVSPDFTEFFQVHLSWTGLAEYFIV